MISEATIDKYTEYIGGASLASLVPKGEGHQTFRRRIATIRYLIETLLDLEAREESGSPSGSVVGCRDCDKNAYWVAIKKEFFCCNCRRSLPFPSKRDIIEWQVTQEQKEELLNVGQ